MAELSTNCGSLDVFDIIGYLFNTLIVISLWFLLLFLNPYIIFLLQEYISPRNVENGSASFQEVDLHHLEPLMYAFHQLCWHHPDFLKKFPGRMKHLREKYYTVNLLRSIFNMSKIFFPERLVCHFLTAKCKWSQFVSLVKESVKIRLWWQNPICPL